MKICDMRYFSKDKNMPKQFACVDGENVCNLLDTACPLISVCALAHVGGGGGGGIIFVDCHVFPLHKNPI